MRTTIAKSTYGMSWLSTASASIENECPSLLTKSGIFGIPYIFFSSVIVGTYYSIAALTLLIFPNATIKFRMSTHVLAVDKHHCTMPLFFLSPMTPGIHNSCRVCMNKVAQLIGS